MLPDRGCTELATPPFVILSGVRIDRLVGPTMDPSVGLTIAGKVDSFDPDGPFDGNLVDPGRHQLITKLDRPRLADVDGDNPAHRANDAEGEKRIVGKHTKSATIEEMPAPRPVLHSRPSDQRVRPAI